MEIKNVRLGDICEFINGDRGRNYPSGKDFLANGIPFINAGHIVDNKISFENMNYITKEKYETLGSGKIQKNDILYCLRGSLGKNAVVDINEGAIASSLVILRPKNDIVNTDYLLIYLNSKAIEEQIDKANNGSSQPNLSAKSVKEFKIFLPSYDYQKKISKILLKAQELIDKRKEQIEALDELVKSKFIEMFGYPATNPKGWNEKTFGDICTVRQGLQIPISKRKNNPSENCLPYITIQFLNGGKSAEYIENPKSTVICNEDDVLMTRTGNTGMVVSGVSGVFHNNFFLIDFDRNILNKIFLVNYLNSNYIQADIIRRAGTSTIPDLNHGEFYKVKILLPQIELQNQFADFVKQVGKLKEEMEKSLKELEDNFNSLMQRAFKGKLF